MFKPRCNSDEILSSANLKADPVAIVVPSQARLLRSGWEWAFSWWGVGLAPIAGGGAVQIEDRNGEIKLRALADFAFHPDAAAVRLDEMFGDGEAESSAANFAGTGSVHAIETFENAGLVGLGDADAGVRDGEFDFGGAGRGAEHDLAAGRGILNRIVEEILQNFGETLAVRRDIRQRLLQIHGKTKVLFGGGALSSVNTASHKLRDAHAVNFQL